MNRLCSPYYFLLVSLAVARAPALGVPPGPRAPDPGPLQAPFDLVIAHGRVMDPESDLDRPDLWVGIRGATIAAISDTALRGRVVVNAAGQVVAPGFIDVLSYEPNRYGIWYKLADGVTTNLAMHGAAWDVGAWYRGLGRSRWPVNYGGAFSDPSARVHLGISPYRAATPEQLRRLVAMAESSMKEGALGVAMSPEYTPGMDEDEVLAMAAVGARYRAPVFFHVRRPFMRCLRRRAAPVRRCTWTTSPAPRRSTWRRRWTLSRGRGGPDSMSWRVSIPTTTGRPT
jgi:hypothetical protein